MDDQYKNDHQNFVSGNDGSTFFETCFILTLMPISVLFQRVVFATFFNNDKFPLPLALRFILEFFFIIVPFISAITFTELTPFLIVGMLITCLVVPMFAQKNVTIYFKNPKETLLNLNSMRKGFLEEYRAFVMAATCICILAVDFQVFPRRLGKTETYGISLMDIGVGSVVLSGALVSRQSRSSLIEKQQKKKREEEEDDNDKINKTSSSSSSSSSALKQQQQQVLSRSSLMWHQVKAQAPLMILGFVRMILTKSINYQEHVSEYGLHWNFFFTLGFVSISLAFLKFNANISAILGVVLICVYQFLLNSFGLTDYILNHPRDNLISMNKEGICSFVGYLAIYLIGTKIGTELFKVRSSLTEWRKFATKLLISSIVFYILWILCEIYIDKTSRRMANLGYVLAILSINLFNFSINILITLITGNHNASVIAKSINRNQLFIFLLGNILTGLINFSMKTIYAPVEQSMIIITSYTFALCLLAFILDYKNINIKFW
ncbi:phosphatidylinositol glycan, class W [Dictyostelium discoideum AX4]|uniref:Phosphatidylinositol-glycan biosynthesis class W protein n=1 Tax=Dictyostelium discoideum TaxID=44689 RepID=PIGW_DICDI|nr:phosphatidylinositol glycan, class W [Dictyostelium discoideum AX4]Q54MC0.2 RecName: Full=Phosphatidylinositol-glycan biosynthesis class W protein [Dictyostelium discoideum]EAL64434.2 phosphatidylinositol glycan, class W [Dictyostelium discoideum AX4]|eukprot:XP_637914.2 phosphatidylinositol glycan, class W [Dictyostelium discoideum AX4]